MISSPLQKRIGGYVDVQWIEPRGDRPQPRTKHNRKHRQGKDHAGKHAQGKRGRPGNIRHQGRGKKR